jgi:DNA-binding HxlR family transcriptional regulator
MQWNSLMEERCPIARFLAVTGDRWSLLLLRQAFRGETRYEEFRHALGVSPTVLSRRLSHLCEHGILERVVDPDRPKRPQYRLTMKGLGLWNIIMSAVHWGETYYPSESESDWVLEHTACDHEFTPQPQMNCSECSQPVALTELRSYRREDGPRTPEILNELAN